MTPKPQHATRAELENRQAQGPASKRMKKPNRQAPPFIRQNCKGCQRPIIYALSLATQKVSPLDPVAAVMAVRMRDGQTVGLPARDWLDDRNRRLAALRDLLILTNRMTVEEWAQHMPDDSDVGIYVSHFATCPQARQFSHQNQEPT